MRKCKLNGTDLLPGRWDIRRGMPPAPPAGYFEAVEEFFPNAKSFKIGGSVVGETTKDHTRVFYCAKCRNVEKAWQACRCVEEF